MIVERIDKPTKLKSWPGQFPVHNLYTVGVAGEKFLRAIQKEGKLLATVCEKCAAEYLPPKIFCPLCLGELTEWKEVSPRGTVETYAADGKGLFAFVRLTKNGGLIHRLGEIAPEKVKIGLKVEAVFEPAATRTGSILDIRYFRPILR